MADDKKKVAEMTFPPNLCYCKEHTWAKVEGDQIKVGISDFAQDQLGDIIFIELPRVGDIFAKGKEFGSAESAKTVSALYMPVSGQIVAVNTAIEDAPDLVNTDPYGAGWMIVVKPVNTSDIEDLLTNAQYSSQL
jgi:glycine cleavage system H protein